MSHYFLLRLESKHNLMCVDWTKTVEIKFKSDFNEGRKGRRTSRDMSPCSHLNCSFFSLQCDVTVTFLKQEVVIVQFVFISL